MKFPTEEGFFRPDIVKLSDFVEDIVADYIFIVLLATLNIWQVVEALERHVIGWDILNWIGLKYNSIMDVDVIDCYKVIAKI